MMNLTRKILVLVLVFCSIPLAWRTDECFADVTNASKSRRRAAEYELKAVYLYNFILFVEWPDEQASKDDTANTKSSNQQSQDSNDTITIGIIGKDPFGDAFAKIEGKLVKAKNKRLIIKRFGRYRKELNLKQCQLLFISPSERKNREKILKQVDGYPTLTVADRKGFLEAGGMVNLVRVRKKIRWEINQTPVKKAEIRLSSQLLRNAVRVVEIPKDTADRGGK
ncbi:MAG: YfiR family protein [Planctomycetota bacterium]|jgi:hypothetical protein